MADALPESALAALDDPFAQLTGPLASTTRLDFEVVDSARLTPHIQRLMLTAPQLDGFGYLPGQDVMLLVAAEGNRPVRRRYTIRQLDEAVQHDVEREQSRGLVKLPDRVAPPYRAVSLGRYQQHHVLAGQVAEPVELRGRQPQSLHVRGEPG